MGSIILSKNSQPTKMLIGPRASGLADIPHHCFLERGAVIRASFCGLRCVYCCWSGLKGIGWVGVFPHEFKTLGNFRVKREMFLKNPRSRDAFQALLACLDSGCCCIWDCKGYRITKIVTASTHLWFSIYSLLVA